MITEKHVISVQNDVGTSYKAYIDVQNELVAAYNEVTRRARKRLNSERLTLNVMKMSKKQFVNIIRRRFLKLNLKKYGGK